MELNDSYHSLLAEYAAGSLDEAHALIVAAHISLSEHGRSYVARYETLGGRLLSGCCTPEPMKADAFNRLMDRIEAAERHIETKNCLEKAVSRCAKDGMPGCVDAYMTKCASKKWKRTSQGSQRMTLPTSCRQSFVEIIDMEPDATVRLHVTKTPLTLLVLDGAMRDARLSLSGGDLVIFEEPGIKIFTAKDGRNRCMIVSRSKRESVFQKLMAFILRG